MTPAVQSLLYLWKSRHQKTTDAMIGRKEIASIWGIKRNRVDFRQNSIFIKMSRSRVGQFVRKIQENRESPVSSPFSSRISFLLPLMLIAVKQRERNKQDIISMEIEKLKSSSSGAERRRV